METKRLLLAGSHAATPAYAVVQEIKLRKLPWEIHFLGGRWAFEGKKIETLEYQELPKLGVKFHSLQAGKLETKFTRYTIPALLKTPFGFIQSLILIRKIKPHLTLSFGGASGAYAAFWSWVFGIPVLVHEQTAAVGRANLFAAKFAQKILLARESSRQFFLGKKVVLTGNPLTQEIIQAVESKPKKAIKTILVTGGSRGSKRINEVIKAILPTLTRKFKVIHLTGEGSRGRLSIKKMAEAFKRADLVIGRAGANTVAEIMALKKPAILIPLPWAYLDEQTKNAEFAAKLGLVQVLPQKFLTPRRLESEIAKLTAKITKVSLKSNPQWSNPDLYAAKKIVKILDKYI